MLSSFYNVNFNYCHVKFSSRMWFKDHLREHADHLFKHDLLFFKQPTLTLTEEAANKLISNT